MKFRMWSARALFVIAAVLLLQACEFASAPGGGGTGAEGLTGILVDTHGARVAGAKVRLYADSGAGLFKHGAVNAAILASASGTDSTTTDADGSFRFTGLAAGRYNLHAKVRNTDTVQVLFISGIEFVKVLDLGTDTLRAAGSLIVHIRGVLNTPLAGARCFIAGSPWTTLSDTSGTCRLTDVAPGGHRLSVSAEGIGTRSDTVTVTPGQATDEGEKFLLGTGQSPQLSATVYEVGLDSVLRARLQLRPDSTYSEEILKTNAVVSNMLVYEQSGRYRVAHDTLYKTAIQERVVGATFGISDWKAPQSGTTARSLLRNVGSAGFERQDGDTAAWRQWTKAAAGAGVTSRIGRLFTDVEGGFSLRVPATWTASVDTQLFGDPNKVRLYMQSAAPPDTLPARLYMYRFARMDSLPLDSLMKNQSLFYPLVISKRIRVLNGLRAAEVVGAYPVGQAFVKERVYILLRGSWVFYVYCNDLATRWDGVNEADLQAIDSSLALF